MERPLRDQKWLSTRELKTLSSSERKAEEVVLRYNNRTPIFLAHAHSLCQAPRKRWKPWKPYNGRVTFHHLGYSHSTESFISFLLLGAPRGDSSCEGAFGLLESVAKANSVSMTRTIVDISKNGQLQRTLAFLVRGRLQAGRCSHVFPSCELEPFDHSGSCLSRLPLLY